MGQAMNVSPPSICNQIFLWAVYALCWSETWGIGGIWRVENVSSDEAERYWCSLCVFTGLSAWRGIRVATDI
jgi:hypothetical protein